MKYSDIPTDDIITKTIEGLTERNVAVHLVNTKEEALDVVTKLIPSGGEVMTGSSTTLQQIGFVDVLKSGKHPWKNLKEEIVQESDSVKQLQLRKMSVSSEYFIGSVHAVVDDGRTVTASASGSQIPSYAFSSDNVIWVVGAQKIVPTIDEAFSRIREYVYPLEDARMKSVGASGSVLAKMFIFEREVMPNRHVHMVLVKEVLGF
ncbi:lactate utilization protein [Patescibacteria group bacterium]|nr:MAG: lactate utilization protein [Patescibacteria group bacterium]